LKGQQAQKEAKPMSKYEKFVANAMKMKVDNDKNIMLGGLGDKLKE
jgi:hypothetical protein|tara:strand:+ start:677 stop:814 length:138 start_codon:yes stop_codon:yes gene_type:complete